jgi:isopenicillin-N N-acyltransferase like protein
MTRSFTSTETDPRRRGAEFGETHREQIAATVDGYAAIFASRGRRDVRADGAAALDAIAAWAPDLARELHGMAAGAGVSVIDLAMINARTEILAALGTSGRGECSTVVHLGDDAADPVAMQNWDWFAGLADNWLVWTIPHADGRTTTTVTEFGMLGKIGVNSSGVGVLFNILHHREDGATTAAVPVHAIARRVLDTAHDANEALLTIAATDAAASTAMTVVTGGAAGKTAITAELWPSGPSFVLPRPDGVLLHTNHFLAAAAQSGDTEPREAPDTLIRYEVLQRALHALGPKVTAADVRAALSSHVGGVCCHPTGDAPLDDQYQTLATVELDLVGATVTATAGPPCERPA